ncbi:MAG: 3-deoxy-7-phosphoheptulonate synthase [Pyrinomonadaceae bacterium]|nr:3-deoxy-7-phosphoheptulonate synthase [Pyrinomonadaceae bacterium]
MLIVMKPDAVESDIEKVVAAVEELNLNAQVLIEKTRATIVVLGNLDGIEKARFVHLPKVAEIIKLTKTYRLSSRDYKPENTIVKIGDAAIGGDELTIIAGVCSVENHEQLFTVAETVKNSGAKLFRGGAFKPRTSPYAFQGLGERGLQMLAEVRAEFDLKIVTEAMDEHGVDLVEKYGDVIQIGARNMQNFSLLKRVGKSHLPVLLKRGFAATLDDLLSSAEYILSEGNENVILCERGIRTFANHARNTLDLSIVPALQKISHLPIIVDPSHGTGKTFMVAPMAKAAVAVGANGVIVEIHPNPERALSDGSQALTPAQYLEMVAQLDTVFKAVQSPKSQVQG